MLSIFKKISGYQKPFNLTSVIAIINTIVKNALNPQTRKVTFELTIAYQGDIVKKDVAVTFKALKVITSSSEKDTSGLATGAIVGTIFGSIFGIRIIGFLIFYFAKIYKKKKTKINY